MKPFVSMISLGARDFARARRFYGDGLGWPVSQEEGEWASFMLNDGATALSLYPWDGIAEEAEVSPEGSGFRGFVLAYNVHSAERVDEVLGEAERAGGAITRPARKTPWGGYSGYFADPEGHLWEVATGATQLPFAE
jgi:catechol 2,3-dioxygenase-like lactoylglutathione lyase family enzyme